MTRSILAATTLLAGLAAVAADTPVPPANIVTNPADAPVRTVSGKVAASTDPDRPPALGPAGAPVLVIVLSDFQ